MSADRGRGAPGVGSACVAGVASGLELGGAVLDADPETPGGRRGPPPAGATASPGADPRRCVLSPSVGAPRGGSGSYDLGVLRSVGVLPRAVVLPLVVMVVLACLTLVHSLAPLGEDGQGPAASARDQMVVAERAPAGSADTAVATADAEHHQPASVPCHDDSGATMECSSPAVQPIIAQVAIAVPLRSYVLPAGALPSWPRVLGSTPAPPAAASTRVILRT